MKNLFFYLKNSAIEAANFYLDVWTGQQCDGSMVSNRSDPIDFLDVFYNRQQRNSYLGHLNPVEFERHLASH